MRDYNHWTVLGILAEFLPLPENRVTLADDKDEYGMPIAHFNYSQCENDKAIVSYARRILDEIWDGADAMDTLTIDRYAHLVGGARMGFTPEDSVIDSSHRVWDVDNLFVVDGSAMPTQGSANPALAIMALADRCASLLDGKAVA
jgi:choline dehydrogenase-like flavoprotein